MSISRSPCKLASCYSILNQKLTLVNDFVDLGVVFDSGFTFVNHVCYLLPKAYSNLAFYVDMRGTLRTLTLGKFSLTR